MARDENERIPLFAPDGKGTGKDTPTFIGSEWLLFLHPFPNKRRLRPLRPLHPLRPLGLTTGDGGGVGSGGGVGGGGDAVVVVVVDAEKKTKEEGKGKEKETGKGTEKGTEGAVVVVGKAVVKTVQEEQRDTEVWVVERCRFLGRLMGKALLDKQIVPLPLATPFFSLLSGRPLALDALSQVGRATDVQTAAAISTHICGRLDAIDGKKRRRRGEEEEKMRKRRRRRRRRS